MNNINNNNPQRRNNPNEERGRFERIPIDPMGHPIRFNMITMKSVLIDPIIPQGQEPVRDPTKFRNEAVSILPIVIRTNRTPADSLRENFGLRRTQVIERNSFTVTQPTFTNRITGIVTRNQQYANQNARVTITEAQRQIMIQNIERTATTMARLCITAPRNIQEYINGFLYLHSFKEVPTQMYEYFVIREPTLEECATIIQYISTLRNGFNDPIIPIYGQLSQPNEFEKRELLQLFNEFRDIRYEMSEIEQFMTEKLKPKVPCRERFHAFMKWDKQDYVYPAYNRLRWIRDVATIIRDSTRCQIRPMFVNDPIRFILKHIIECYHHPGTVVLYENDQYEIRLRDGIPYIEGTVDCIVPYSCYLANGPIPFHDFGSNHVNFEAVKIFHEMTYGDTGVLLEIVPYYFTRSQRNFNMNTVDYNQFIIRIIRTGKSPCFAETAYFAIPVRLNRNYGFNESWMHFNSYPERVELDGKIYTPQQLFEALLIELDGRGEIEDISYYPIDNQEHSTENSNEDSSEDSSDNHFGRNEAMFSA